MLDLKLDNRKEIKIYDPALCCSTGICGVDTDPELFRISIIIDNLKKKGIIIERFNLKDTPQTYIDNKVINECLQKQSIEALPITTLGGEIVCIGKYPSNQQISEWLNVKEEELTEK